MYEKQNFYSGQKLMASQLNAMEEGIIEALNKESISSWNDLTDKPFGEEYVSLGDTLTWDGEATEDSFDIQGMMIYQKLSSDALTVEELETGEIVYVQDGVENTMPIKGNYSEYLGSFSIVSGYLPLFMIVPYDGWDSEGVAFDKGIYAVNIPTQNVRAKSITVPNKDFKKSIVKQINPKFIPNYEAIMVVNIKQEVDMATQTVAYTADKTYSQLSSYIMIGGKVAADCSSVLAISGATGQGRFYTDNFSWTQTTVNGSSTGSITFAIAPDVKDGKIILHSIRINHDDTVEGIDVSLTIPTE